MNRSQHIPYDDHLLHPLRICGAVGGPTAISFHVLFLLGKGYHHHHYTVDFQKDDDKETNAVV